MGQKQSVPDSNPLDDVGPASDDRYETVLDIIPEASSSSSSGTVSLVSNQTDDPIPAPASNDRRASVQLVLDSRRGQMWSLKADIPVVFPQERRVTVPAIFPEERRGSIPLVVTDRRRGTVHDIRPGVNAPQTYFQYPTSNSVCEMSPSFPTCCHDSERPPLPKMGDSMPEDVKQDFLDAYLAADDNHNGQITPDRFMALMVALGVPGGVRTAQALLQKFVGEKTTVNQEEYLAAVKHAKIKNTQVRIYKDMYQLLEDKKLRGWATQKSMENSTLQIYVLDVRQATHWMGHAAVDGECCRYRVSRYKSMFLMFDKKKKGWVSQKSMEVGLTDMGIDIEDEEIQEKITDMYQDHGRISFGEFLRVQLKMPSTR